MTGTRALQLLRSGAAQQYYAEYQARVKLLTDETKDTVELSAFTQRPYVLFFADGTEDTPGIGGIAPLPITMVKRRLSYGKHSGRRIFSLKNGEKYCILVSLCFRPSVCGKAALVGESAVPCNLQSATAGMNSGTRGTQLCCLTLHKRR